MENQFIILIENTKTKQVYHSGFTICSHKECCVLMSKMIKRNDRRIFLHPM